jgi:hypothetical protein
MPQCLAGAENPLHHHRPDRGGPQDAWHIKKIEAIDERLSFSPWHALAAHRPLGAVNPARKPAYPASASFRAAHNHVAITEPKTLEEVTEG